MADLFGGDNTSSDSEGDVTDTFKPAQVQVTNGCSEDEIDSTNPPQNGANSPGVFYDARNGGEGEEEGQREARGSRDEIKVAVVGFQKTVEDYTYDVEVCLILV